MIVSTLRTSASAAYSRIAGLSGLALILSILVGCTDTSPQRIAVGGTVTLDSNPIGNSTIILTPIGPGLAAAAVIDNGRFAMTEENGPTIGDFHVRINPMEAEIEDVKPAELPRVNRRPLVPKIYQRDGKLRTTISADPNQQLEFRLLSTEK